MLTEEERCLTSFFFVCVSLPSPDSPPSQSPLLLGCASASPHLFQTLTSLCPVNYPWHPPRFLLWLCSLQSANLTGCFCAPTCINFVPFSVLPALWIRNNPFIDIQRTERTGWALLLNTNHYTVMRICVCL